MDFLRAGFWTHTQTGSIEKYKLQRLFCLLSSCAGFTMPIVPLDACVNGCPGPICARGLCRKCYRRLSRRADFIVLPKPSLAERFWSKVDKNGTAPAHVPELGPCWIWTARRDYGYGRFWLDGHLLRVHRVAWELHHGFIPIGLCVLHRCDNRQCVNVEHLFLGTPADNAADMMSKGRHVAPCGDRNGARLHPESLARGDRHWSHLHPERFARCHRQEKRQ